MALSDAVCPYVRPFVCLSLAQIKRRVAISVDGLAAAVWQATWWHNATCNNLLLEAKAYRLDHRGDTLVQLATVSEAKSRNSALLSPVSHQVTISPLPCKTNIMYTIAAYGKYSLKTLLLELDAVVDKVERSCEVQYLQVEDDWSFGNDHNKVRSAIKSSMSAVYPVHIYQFTNYTEIKVLSGVTQVHVMYWRTTVVQQVHQRIHFKHWPP